MSRFNSKIIAYTLVLALFSVSFYGCNKNDDAAATEAEPSEDGNVSDEQALQNAIADALGDNDTPEDNADQDATAAPEADDAVNTASGASATPTAIAERSPVEITRIEVPDVEDDDDDVLGEDDDKDPHEHEVTPNLFPVDKCQIEINGLFQIKLAKDLIKEINKRRADRQIGPLAENTGLQACSDARCKEQTYFIGHFRPDGSAFDSVGRGYVQGECIAIDYRTVNDIMEAWFSVNESRYQIMNPEYTQVGISIYDIGGIYYIAAEFGY